MNIKELETRICELSNAEDSFYVKLRVHLEFDEQQFLELFELLKTYVDLTKQDTYIHREVFGSLYYLDGVLVGALSHLSHLNDGIQPWEPRDPKYQRVSDAHARVLDIFMQLMNPVE